MTTQAIATIYTATIDATFGIKKPSGLVEDFRTGRKTVSFPCDSQNDSDKSGLALTYLHEWVEELLKDGESIVSYKIHSSEVSL
jgi:hypothetical protein